MKRFFKVFLFFFALLSSFNSFSQQFTSSPYSRYGVGDLFLPEFGEGVSLSGTSIALRSTYHLNPDNPAALTAIPLQTFVFEVGVNGKFTSLETKTTKDNANAVTFGYLGFAFPVTKWMGMSIGFLPYSASNYKISNDQPLYKSAIDLTSVADVRNLLQGSGGITQYYVSTGIKPFKGFSIGGKLYALIGSIDKSGLTSVYQDSSLVSSLETSTSVKIRDINYSLGFQYEHTFGKTNLCVGAVLDNKKDLSSLSTRYKALTVNGYYTTVFMNDTVSKDASGKYGNGIVSLPQNLSIGLALSNDKYLFALDYRTQDWTQARFFGQKDANLGVSKRYSMGLEYTPDILSARYWKFVKYKVGAYYSNSYVQIPLETGGSQGINEYGVSLGLDLPILNKSFTLVCPSIQFGSRGTTDNGFAREKFFVFHLNFTMNDRWFMKRKID